MGVHRPVASVVSALCLVMLVLGGFLGVSAAEEKPVVVCTTTVLASVVRDLAGDQVVVEVVSSPAVCPAHYDVTPSDVEKFRHAALIFMHGFEPWVEELREASGSQAPVIKISGPWGVPEMLKAKYEAVAAGLEENLGIDVSESLETVSYTHLTLPTTERV